MTLRIKHLIYLLLISILCCYQLQAQQVPMNIDKLTDQQLLQLAAQYQLIGLSESELEEKAREKGLSADQIAILKKRMVALGPDALSGAGANTITSKGTKAETYVKRNQIAPSANVLLNDSTGKLLRIYGAEIFGNENLSFEPNLAIATPTNYIIGVNDQLIIDIFGLSDNTKKLRVTPEGYIRFPNYGPIRVVGLTFEQARVKIKNELSKIYPGLQKGTVSLQVSLGEVRSIHVTLLGEVKYPGRYTISSLATLFNALYISGGPNSIGSFRNIELIRNGTTIVIFDLYDFLVKADLTKNTLLQDEDIIRITPYAKRVVLTGAVKKPAIFDLTPKEGVNELLKYAGGFSDLAYKERFRIMRLGSRKKEVFTLSYKEFNEFALVSGDTVVVDTLAAGYSNRIQIDGAVFYKGIYSLQNLPTLKDILLAAELKENAYRKRAVLRRLGDDFSRSLINFNIDDILQGKQNFTLKREDSIHIFTEEELREKYAVTISGEINKPGTYDYFQKMTVQDLVLLAGGYTDGAAQQKIEISRRLRQPLVSSTIKDTSTYAIIKEIDLSNTEANQSLDFLMEPFDEVMVRKSPRYKPQINVFIEGEVIFPGRYTLSANTDKLTDLIKRAGGLKQTAFTNGAALIRKTYLNKNTTNGTIASLNTAINKVSFESATGDSAKLKANESYNIEPKPVALKLSEALASPGGLQDIALEEGDILKIPKYLELVQTFGAVNVPKQMIYTEGLTIRRAIRSSGGFALNAARRNIYVINANGQVKSTRRFLFFRHYPSIDRGSEIHVPTRLASKKSTAELVAISGSIVSLAGLIIALINTTK